MKKSYFKTKSPFRLESGEALSELTLCYHHSDEYEPHKKVIWICHALTANSDPESWWPQLVGPGKLFDTERYYVVCANMIGSCYGSSGPASDSATGRPYLLKFPKLTIRDIVRSQYMLKEHLKIPVIDLIVGGSIGGFQALEWSILYPHTIRHMVLIACNARVSPWGTAFNESQRMALFSDPSFLEEKDINGGKKGLETARSIALISYRSYEGYKQTQAEDDERPPVFARKSADYQRYQGQKLSKRFDAYSYYTLTNAVDSHNVGRKRGGIAKALENIEAETIVIGINSDGLFPVREQKFLASHIKGAEFDIIRSEYGHDGFLIENRQIESIVKKHIHFLNREHHAST